MRLADVILLYTDKEVDEYRRFGFASDKLFATNNTIDTSEIEFAKKKWIGKKIEIFKRKHNLQNSKNLIFCGRLIKKAQLNIAFKALAELISKNPEYRLIVIGDGEEKTKLINLAQRLGINTSVYWLGAIYNNFELAPWFLSSSVFVYPGSIGLSIIHAFAYGLPVITHEKSRMHMPEFYALKNNVNGLVFKHGDFRDLASKIRYLAENKTTSIYMQKNAQNTIHKNFSFDEMVKRFVNAVDVASKTSII
jgi:glycosyltransferase involved in cell wall biosynthesis